MKKLKNIHVHTQETFFDQVLQSLEDYGVFTTDTEGYITSWNQGAEHILGYNEKEVLGKNASIFFTVEDRKQGADKKELNEALTVGKSVDERWHLRKNRTRFWGSGKVFALKNSEGIVIGCTKIIRDLTSKKEATEKIKNREIQYKKLLEQTPAFIAILRGKNHIVEYVNPHYYQLVGFRDITGKPLGKAIPELKRQGFISLLDSVYATGKEFVGKELKMLVKRDPDSPWEERYIDIVYQPTRSDGGRISGIFTHGVDITDQVLARKKMQESEERFRTLANQAPVLIWMTDEKGKATYLNKQWIDFTGADEKKSLGHGWRSFIYDEDREEAVRLLNEVISQQKPYDIKFRLRRHDGNTRWMLCYGAPRYNDDGQFIGYVGTCSDIHDQEEIRRQLDDERQQLVLAQRNLRFLSDASKVLSSSLDYTQTLQRVAEIAIPHIGDWCSVDILENTSLRQVALAHMDPKKMKMVKEYRKLNPQNLQASTGSGLAITSKKSILYPVITDELLRKNSYSKRQLTLARMLHIHSVMIVPIIIAEKAVGVISFISTDPKRTYTPGDLAMAEELAGRASLAIENARLYSDAQLMSERLSIALNAGTIGVWDWDMISGAITWTDSVYKIHGVDPQTFPLDYPHYRTLIHPDDRPTVEAKIKKAIEERIPYQATFRSITPSGDMKWVSTSAHTTYTKQGKPIRMLGATTDITKQKQLEQDKNDFISIATHELKTPVTSIKAYAEALQRRFSREGNQNAAGHLGKMNAQLNKLTGLIEDLLDTTKIEAGKLYMREEEFPFDPLIEEVVEEMQRTTEHHQIQIKGSTKKTVRADRERIGQVVTNLISNAIKYSPQSDSVSVELSVSGRSVQVCVQDFGVGIPKKKKDRVFERFYRISGPKEKTFPGLGLGLFISSEIIKREGGRIWVESELGKGSTFCFTLPLQRRT